MATNDTHLGIFMDHASAHLMEFVTSNHDTIPIVSKFTPDEKV